MRYKIEDITDGDVVLIEGWEGSYEVLSHYQSEESVPRLVVQPTEGDTKPRYFPSISQVTMILYNVNDRVSQTEEQYTGSSSSYYRVYVKNPTTLELPYEAECNDIIEALQMNFAEGNAFKAIWRKAKARQGVKKKGYDNGVYDSEKVVFFGERMLIQAKADEQ